MLVETSDKLPFSLLSEVNCLFVPVNTREEMLEKQDWENCYIVETKPLKQCADCVDYLLPEQPAQELCLKCETKALKDDLEDDFLSPKKETDYQPYLVVAGLAVVIIFIAYENS